MPHITLRPGDLFEGDKKVLIDGIVISGKDILRLVFLIGQNERRKYQQDKPHWRMPGAMFWTVACTRAAIAETKEELERICEEHGLR